MLLYHATPFSNIESILKTGLRPGSFWCANTDLLDYYVETIEDEDQVAAIIEVKIELFDPEFFTPDFPGLSEPISLVIGIKEDRVWPLWLKTEQSWQACLELIGSVRYNKTLIVGNDCVYDELE